MGAIFVIIFAVVLVLIIASWIISKRRDRTIRGELCSKLSAIGLDACIVKRGRAEEDISGGVSGKSLGLIEIRDGPIRWVNVLRHAYSGTAPGGGGVIYTNVYLVHDRTTPKGGNIELRSVRVKSVPVFGQVVDLRWEASLAKTMMGRMPILKRKRVPVEMESNLIREMNEDISLKESLIRLKEDVTIHGFPGWGWAMSARGYEGKWFGGMPKGLAPPWEKWDCYIRIARHLLESVGK